MTQIYMQTFGCQMNVADSNGLAHQAWSMGCTFVADPAAADILILNTCAIREKAETRVYGRLGQLKALKDQRPDAKLLVCGCLAEKDRDVLRVKAPWVDATLGPRDYRSFKRLLGDWGVATDAPPPEAVFTMPSLEDDPGLDAHAEYAHLRALVNITRGCEKFCTYCIVPYTRGPLESIAPEEIEAQIRRELRAGAKEIMLLGQNVNSYSYEGLDFSGLLRRLGRIEGIERLTFLTSHPKDFDAGVVDALASLPNVAPRMHLPMQSASNTVLDVMARQYTIEAYLEKVGYFRERLRGWALTTDIIVGYPTETEADFLKTLEVVQAGTFESAFIFAYSPRAGTPAATMEPQVPQAEKIRRLQAVNAAQNEATRRFHESFIGETVRVLAQGPSKKDASRMAGKSGHNVTVIYPRDARTEHRAFVDVVVEQAYNWGLAGVPA